MKSCFISDQLDIVYVNELTGTNEALCGTTWTTPCKDLSEGISRTKEYGIVYIMGNQHLLHTIVLKKSINIRSDIGKEKGKLSGSNNVVFQLRCGIKVMLKELYFINIGVIDAHHCKHNKPHVVMDGITVMNTTGQQRIIRVGKDERSYGIKSGSLIVRNSLFQDTTGFYLLYMKNIQMCNCMFTNPTQER